MRELYVRLLHRGNMEVVTAENGTAALEMARRAAPDLVVTDLDMPEMGGLELCRRLRAGTATRRIPVVVVTGDAAVQTQAAIEAGCDAVLGKPCSETLLRTTIRVLLDRCRRGSDPSFTGGHVVSSLDARSGR